MTSWSPGRREQARIVLARAILMIIFSVAMLIFGLLLRNDGVSYLLIFPGVIGTLFGTITARNALYLLRSVG